jgi:large subunit ribosomal protein L6
MSRIGKIPVKLPKGVRVNFQDEVMTVEGPKGKLAQKYHSVISFKSEEDEIIVSRLNEEKQTKAFHGLYRNLLNNMIIGVSTSFTKTLIITGVGYRAEVQEKILTMCLGYSADIFMGIPEGISVTVEGGGKIMVSGINKQQVGEFAAQIRKLRIPEPYKGKGIRYENEKIRRKVGKSGVK